MNSASPPTARFRFAPNPALVIVGCALTLLALGLMVLFSASAAFRQGTFFYLNKQVVGALLATGLAWWASRTDLERWRAHVWWIGGTAAVLLAAVRVPGLGITVKGSHRWLGYGAARLQVSEFAKVVMVFCLAHTLSVNQTRIRDWRHGFVPALGIVAGFTGLVVIEPDFGMAALFLAVGLVMLFLAGARWRHLLATGGIAVALLALLLVFNPNRMQRLADFRGKELPYQLKQALAAYAAGGLDGVGLGEGRQQLAYLPEAHTDFIFAVVGEELGLWATLGVVAVFVAIFVAGLAHLRRAPNLFQFLLVAGALFFITMQALINLLVVTGSVPPKGMSLPFISAGLSNLLVMGLMIGLILNTRRSWPRPGFGGGRALLEVPPERPETDRS
ncbi:MAG: putative peptidoglycan glycosyltransferase FtsW [Verrucomicrobiota bacterium]